MASTFNVTLNGEAITIDLEDARRLCPDEVAAMERAGDEVAQATRSAKGVGQASEKLYDSMASLLHAYAKAKRAQRESSQS